MAGSVPSLLSHSKDHHEPQQLLGEARWPQGGGRKMVQHSGGFGAETKCLAGAACSPCGDADGYH